MKGPGDTNAEPVTVFKVGGSLLDLPDLAERLQRVLAQRADSQPLLVIGGGMAADLVRGWDAVHRLSDETAHWLAIRAMGLNERIVESIFDNSRVVTDRGESNNVWIAGCVPILNCCEFLRTEEIGIPVDERLPRNWNVTSDSIAGWIANRWPARELVLVKSRDLSPDWSDDVDREFPSHAGGELRIGWVNLRADLPKIVTWEFHERFRVP